LDEAAFLEVCDACGECITACPENILLADGLGRPRVEFSAGGCTFCDVCAQSCTRGAFHGDRERFQPWKAAAEVSNACLEHRGITCRTCEVGCEPMAISFSPRPGGISHLRIDAERCNGCGACVALCPVDALKVRLDESRNQPALEGQG
jgi:ferredoxin-type protein NapF